MVNLCRRYLSLVALAALGGTPALAQTPTGRITGVVRDSLNVPRDGATVRATNNATKFV